MYIKFNVVIPNVRELTTANLLDFVKDLPKKKTEVSSQKQIKDKNLNSVDKKKIQKFYIKQEDDDRNNHYNDDREEHHFSSNGATQCNQQ